MAEADPCPNCGGQLRYFIQMDRYVCKQCAKEYDVLDVENDHIAYRGKPNG